MRNSTIASITLIVLLFIISLYLYPQMPEQMAIHWGIEGTADGYGSKLIGLFFIPVVLVLLFPLMYVLPRIDPSKGLEKFRSTYEWFVFGFLFYMGYVHLLSLAWNLGWRFSFIRLLAPAIGLLFMGIGLVLRDARLNWFMGIRTPWTLSNEGVWDKTHDVGGKLFILCGALASLGALTNGWLSLLVIMAPGILTTIFLFAFSYREYKKLEIVDN
jgi:uncharacterized membrane protein